MFCKSATRLPSLHYHPTVNPPTQPDVDGNDFYFHVEYGQDLKHIYSSPLNPHFRVSTMEPSFPPKRQHNFQRKYMKFLYSKTVTHWGLQSPPFGPQKPFSSNIIITLTIVCKTLLLIAQNYSSWYFPSFSCSHSWNILNHIHLVWVVVTAIFLSVLNKVDDTKSNTHAIHMSPYASK